MCKKAAEGCVGSGSESTDGHWWQVASLRICMGTVLFNTSINDRDRELKCTLSELADGKCWGWHTWRMGWIFQTSLRNSGDLMRLDKANIPFVCGAQQFWLTHPGLIACLGCLFPMARTSHLFLFKWGRLAFSSWTAWAEVCTESRGFISNPHCKSSQGSS